MARYHNVYGPYGTWDGGREKAPAAVSRKVAMAVIAGKHEIEIWGDGEQTRSFMYIDDCLIGTQKAVALRRRRTAQYRQRRDGDHQSTRRHRAKRSLASSSSADYKLDAPKGVRGRNSDNTLIKAKLGWAPNIPLRDGMEQTYRWIYDQAKAREEGRPYIGVAA